MRAGFVMKMSSMFDPGLARSTFAPVGNHQRPLDTSVEARITAVRFGSLGRPVNVGKVEISCKQIVE